MHCLVHRCMCVFCVSELWSPVFSFWIWCTHCDEWNLAFILNGHAVSPLLWCTCEEMSFSAAASCILLMAEAAASAAGRVSSCPAPFTPLWLLWASRRRCSPFSSALGVSLSPRFSSNSLFMCPSRCSVFSWEALGCWWGKVPPKSADLTRIKDSQYSCWSYSRS